MPTPARLRQAAEAKADACATPVRLVHDRDVFDRQEVTAAGFDDFKAGVTTGGSFDPLYGPNSTGIRIPPFASPNAYRVLCAVANLDAGDMVVGIRQGLELGAIIGSVDDSGNPIAPMYPLLRPVVTYNWRFIDAAWVWTLTRQPLAPWSYQVGPNDSDTFAFRDSLSPAMLYAAATFPATPIFPGYIGLNSYTPPAMQGSKVLVARDIRWPFDSDQADDELWIPVRRPERWRLYCDVLQTNPTTRNEPTIGTNTDVRQITGLVPEEEFLQFCKPLANLAVAPIVWRAHGRLVVQRVRKERA